MAGMSQTSTVIEVKSLSKQMPSTQGVLEVLDGVDLEVGRGEFLSIIGPSGCGKSTLLNILAGLDAPSTGDVALEGEATSARLGRVAYMQQKDLLMPWRSVLENAVLGLEVAGVQRGEARQRAQALMCQFGLSGFEQAYPSMLSGGMRQRVAFLRTILAERDVLLLDEPFGALDALTRSQMHEWLLELWTEFGKTIVLVTHDVDEAVFLSDRVYVMTGRPGSIKSVFNVDLPRPRTLELVTDTRFTTLKAELLRSIRESATRGQA